MRLRACVSDKWDFNGNLIVRRGGRVAYGCTHTWNRRVKSNNNDIMNVRRQSNELVVASGYRSCRTDGDCCAWVMWSSMSDEKPSVSADQRSHRFAGSLPSRLPSLEYVTRRRINIFESKLFVIKVYIYIYICV